MKYFIDQDVNGSFYYLQDLVIDNKKIMANLSFIILTIVCLKIVEGKLSENAQDLVLNDLKMTPEDEVLLESGTYELDGTYEDSHGWRFLKEEVDSAFAKDPIRWRPSVIRYWLVSNQYKIYENGSRVHLLTFIRNDFIHDTKPHKCFALISDHHEKYKLNDMKCRQVNKDELKQLYL